MHDCIRRIALRLRGLLPSGGGRHRARSHPGPARVRAAALPVPTHRPRPWNDPDSTVELNRFTLVRPYVLADEIQRAAVGGAR